MFAPTTGIQKNTKTLYYTGTNNQKRIKNKRPAISCRYPCESKIKLRIIINWRLCILHLQKQNTKIDNNIINKNI